MCTIPTLRSSSGALFPGRLDSILGFVCTLLLTGSVDGRKTRTGVTRPFGHHVADSLRTARKHKNDGRPARRRPHVPVQPSASSPTSWPTVALSTGAQSLGDRRVPPVAVRMDSSGEHMLRSLASSPASIAGVSAPAIRSRMSPNTHCCSSTTA